jgi:hypothetical protein
MGICLRAGLPFWLIHKMVTLLFYHQGSGLEIGFFSLYCSRAEMSLRCRQKFPGKEKCPWSIITFWNLLKSILHKEWACLVNATPMTYSSYGGKYQRLADLGLRIRNRWGRDAHVGWTWKLLTYQQIKSCLIKSLTPASSWDSRRGCKDLLQSMIFRNINLLYKVFINT